MKLNKKAMVAAGVAAVAVIGGTYAYYNQSVSLENPLHTGDYQNVLVEDYTPPTDEVVPGAVIDKVAGVKNTGDYPVLVRVRMDEVWSRDGVDIPYTEHHSSDKDSDGDSTFSVNPNIPFYAPQYNDAPGTTDPNGEVEGDHSVVGKLLVEDWENNWVDGQDGYWYYKKVLKPDMTETIDLLNRIVIASDIDLGKYINNDYYYVGTLEDKKEDIVKSDDEAAKLPEAKVWKKYETITLSDGKPGFKIDGEEQPFGDLNKDESLDAIDLATHLGVNSEKQKLFRMNESLLDEKAQGYANANYTLKITSDFVQADLAAVKAAWEIDGLEALKKLGLDVQEDPTNKGVIIDK